MEIKSLILEKVQLAANRILEGQMLYSLDANFRDWYIEKETRDLILSLRTEVMAEKIAEETIIYPKDWWQAFKERWFGKYLKKWYPVIYKKIIVKGYATYPELRMVCPKEKAKAVIHYIKNEWTE